VIAEALAALMASRALEDDTLEEAVTPIAGGSRPGRAPLNEVVGAMRYPLER